jgi:hypothetical protein
MPLRRTRKWNIILAALLLVAVGPVVSFAQELKIGEPAPDFALPSLDGQQTIRLSDFRGRRVLIFTWASW